MNWIVKSFDELTKNELYAILQLRSEVFVVEQTCAYQDMDGIDQQTLHLFLEENNKMVAYARLIPPGLTYESAAIGRVVTSPLVRSKGYGKALMNEAIKQIRNKFNATEITISAQMYLLKFYNELGFKEIGDTYLEDNIPHIKMKINK